MRELRVAVIITVTVGCSTNGTDFPELPDLPGDAQAISLLGDTLHPPPLPDSVRADRDQKLAVAQAGYDHAPDNADSIIWLGSGPSGSKTSAVIATAGTATASTVASPV